MKSFHIQRQSVIDSIFRPVIEFASKQSAIDWLTNYLSRNSEQAERFRIVETNSTVLINGPDLSPRFTRDQLAEFILQFDDCYLLAGSPYLRVPNMSLASLIDIVGKIARHFNLANSDQWRISWSIVSGKLLIQLPEFEPDWNSVGTSTN
jgi:hypothetical protein